MVWISTSQWFLKLVVGLFFTLLLEIARTRRLVSEMWHRSERSLVLLLVLALSAFPYPPHFLQVTNMCWEFCLRSGESGAVWTSLAVSLSFFANTTVVRGKEVDTFPFEVVVLWFDLRHKSKYKTQVNCNTCSCNRFPLLFLYLEKVLHSVPTSFLSCGFLNFTFLLINSHCVGIGNSFPVNASAIYAGASASVTWPTGVLDVGTVTRGVVVLRDDEVRNRFVYARGRYATQKVLCPYLLKWGLLFSLKKKNTL